MPQPETRTKTVKSEIFGLRGRSDRFYPDKGLNPEHTKELEGVNITEIGTTRRNFGNAKYNANQITETAAAKSVTGLHQQKFADGSVVNFEVAGTKVYTDDGTTRTDRTGTLTLTDSVDARYRFAFIKDQVVATNGVDETWVNSGSGNSTALAGVQHTTCEDVVMARNILFSLAPTESGTKYPTRIRWCDINTATYELDITVWPADSFYEVYEGGYGILGGVEAFGRLIVIKEDGVYPIKVGLDNGFIEAYADEAMKPLRGEFTPVAKSSIIGRPDMVFFVATDGAYIVGPDLSFKLVTQSIQDTWNNLNKGRIQYAQSFVRESDHQIRTLLSSNSNSTGHDRVLVFDYVSGDVWIEPTPQTIGFIDEWTILNDPFDVTGSIDGYVRKGNDSGSPDYDGSSINWKIRGASNDLGYPGKTKHIVQFITHYKSIGGRQTNTLQIYRDDGVEKSVSGNLLFGTLLTYNANNQYNSGLQYGGGQSAQQNLFINRGADIISPQWNGTQDFELIGYQVEFTVTE